MTIEAELPDGRVLEFPDGTDPGVIQATVKKMLGVPAQQPQPKQPVNKSLDTTKTMLRGFMRGGPMGALAAGTGVAMQNLDEAAYEAGGLATDAAAKVLPPEAAAGVGTVVNTAIPSVIGSQAAKVVSPLMKNAATGLMQSALKPSMKALKMGKGDDAVKTMLDEGINVSRGGVEKLHGKIDDLNDQITTLLDKSGATVDKGQVAARIQDVVKRIESTYSTPQDALKSVEKVYEQFMSNHLIPKDIPVQQAQRLKHGIYRMLKDKYGQLESETAEAQKALGRGYKETIAEKIPEISQLNAHESKLINAITLAEHRALQAGNKDLVGIGFLISHPQALPAFLADRSPLFKSIIARLMHSGRDNLPAAAGAATGGMYQTVQSNRQK